MTSLSGNGTGTRRATSAHHLYDDVPVDANGLPLLNAPGLTWPTQYAIAMQRYSLSLGVVPYASRYLTDILDLAAVVNKIARRHYRQYEVGTPTDYTRLFRTYIDQVEAVVGYDAARSRLAIEWKSHATDLRARWGSAFEQP